METKTKLLAKAQQAGQMYLAKAFSAIFFQSLKEAQSQQNMATSKPTLFCLSQRARSMFQISKI